MTAKMTADYWQAAQAIAQQLSETGTKVNELKKVVAYLCWLRSRKESVGCDRLFAYLDAMAQHGEQHGQNTPLYYRTIKQACHTHLHPLQVDGNALIQILGWAARLKGQH